MQEEPGHVPRIPLELTCLPSLPLCRLLSPFHLCTMCMMCGQVYKENLVETILPSIQSVMTAVLHYKKMGGEANLYINDDGLQVMAPYP